MDGRSTFFFPFFFFPFFFSFFCLLLLPYPKPARAVDFVFNGFNSSTRLLLFSNATVDPPTLTLTEKIPFSIGRALYGTKIRTKEPITNSVIPFSSSFIFSMAPYRDTLPGHGIVFLFTPSTGINGSSSSQHMGLFNHSNNGDPRNHVFAVEFDVFANQEFDDIDDNHVGIDVNSLKSRKSHTAGYWPNGEEGFKRVKLNNGQNYQVWVDYNDSSINVTMAPVGAIRPTKPLLSAPLDLSDVLLDEMYVGFTSATGRLVESHRILAWSFSNTNFSLSRSLVTTGLPSFVLPKDPITKSKWFISVLTLLGFVVVVLIVLFSILLVKRKRERDRRRAEMEDWELEYWPHRMSYQEIESATKGFSEANVIGIGGSGKVYKGTLAGGVDVAVKLISCENGDGTRKFLAEVSSLGRLKHRNLVALRGWCKNDRGSFMLVYDYMDNGSLDRLIFRQDRMLSFEERVRILRDVASGLLYLHEGWESRVLHRDIKSSNVLLDRDMNGRLGDFGLARMQEHNQAARTTRVVGTAGFLAPEVVRTGRYTAKSDVFGFGVLVLEVMSGRRPVEEGKPSLVDWVWELMLKGEILSAVDGRIRREAPTGLAEQVLQLGLICAYPEAGTRPTMRQAMKILEGKRSNGEGLHVDSEDMEAYLLEKAKGRELWSKYNTSSSSSFSSHPTFEDVRKSRYSSASLSSWTTTLLEGR